MAAVLVQIRGVLYDLLGRTSQQVVLQGEASVLGLGVGGGPIIPPEGGGGAPDHIWGGGNVPMPTPPIANVPGAPGYRPPGDHIWGPGDPRPTPPIYLPPGYPGDGPTLPPEMKPPQTPPPGTVTPVPGNWPTSGIVPPEYVVMQYPGIGPVVVTAPPHAEPAG